MLHKFHNKHQRPDLSSVCRLSIQNDAEQMRALQKDKCVMCKCLPNLVLISNNVSLVGVSPMWSNRDITAGVFYPKDSVMERVVLFSKQKRLSCNALFDRGAELMLYVAQAFPGKS